jgi:catechol 2,3-dioxygenase-like lactoylglutathione lyase family enzyme
MSSTDISSDTSMETLELCTIDMKLEVVTLPVSDVDRAKRFYQSLGWRLDADIVRGDAFRAVQLTPLHSACSIAFGKGLTTDEPGSIQRLLLAVSDIDAAREDLISRGVEVSEAFHLPGGAGRRPVDCPALVRRRRPIHRRAHQGMAEPHPPGECSIVSDPS